MTNPSSMHETRHSKPVHWDNPEGWGGEGGGRGGLGWGTHGGLHGQRSLMGCSPRGHKESDTTDQLYHSNSVELWNKESMCSFYSSFTSSQFRELSLKV